MSTVYGGVGAQDERPYITVTVTQNTTNCVFSIIFGIQAVNKIPYRSTAYNVSGQLQGNFEWKSYSKSFTNEKSQWEHFAVGSKTVTVSRLSSARSFYVQWDGVIKNPSGGENVLVDSSPAYYSYTVPALPTYTVSYSANGGSGAPGNQTKQHGTNITLSSTKPTRTGYSFSTWNTASNGTGTNYASGGTYTGNANLALYAKWTANTYTVSYNANGGQGAPSNQTKTYGTNLTLSSTRPTRTGYSFSTWNTASNGSGTNYAPGATYSGNSALTLYAQWTINTYAVTYHSNGGSGAPSNQTKTYGTDLTLRRGVPTRTDYKFVKWNTNESGTGISYMPGATYTTNAAVTLYAQWQSVYTAPQLNNLTAQRVNSANVDDSEGTYVKVSFNWVKGISDTTDVNPEKIKIYYKLKRSADYTLAKTITSPTNTTIIENLGNNFNIEEAYDIKVVLTPEGDRATIERTTYISISSFIIDVNANGTAIGFGQQAPDDEMGVFVNMDLTFRSNIFLEINQYASLDTVDADFYNVITATLGWENEVI